MTEYFFIGIDGGASSCRARLRDMEGNLLGEGCGGPANIHLDLDLAKELSSSCKQGGCTGCGSRRAHSSLRSRGVGLSRRGLEEPMRAAVRRTEFLLRIDGGARPMPISPGLVLIRAAMAGL